MFDVHCPGRAWTIFQNETIITIIIFWENFQEIFCSISFDRSFVQNWRIQKENIYERRGDINEE